MAKSSSSSTGPRVAILMGSKSDWPVMEQAAKTLEGFGVPYDAHAYSAHRSPELLRQYLGKALAKGVKLFIAAAGGSAHLAGVVAAHTTLPVIGVPIESKSLKGLDSLLSTVQMPPGVPVATVGIDAATNAAILAIQCLAISDERLAKALAAYKQQLEEKVRQADSELLK